MPKYVLFYESADDVASKAPAHFPAQQEDGSMAIFTTRQAAEAFARSDPFVLNGVVRRWSVREWNEAIARS
ncbi:MAG: hypothetical protein E6I47_09145 [Chloroflexi bacterium]|nr:MAG: hypothetical protein E6I47_09145 [Chloroflexota bacterium]